MVAPDGPFSHDVGDYRLGVMAGRDPGNSSERASRRATTETAARERWLGVGSEMGGVVKVRVVDGYMDGWKDRLKEI